MIFVKNTNSFVFRGRYDGVDIEFPINERVPIGNEAARHIFGFGDEDKTPVLVKQGWCIASNKTEDGLRILNRFVFSQEDPVPAEEKDKENTDNIPKFAARMKSRAAHVEEVA
jgi:hypothetical protein